MPFRNAIPKNLFALALIFCLGWIVLGIPNKFLVDQYMVRKAIKQRIKQGVPQEQLTAFSLGFLNQSEEILWLDDHEFRLNGRMYDVVRTDEKNVYCIHDDQEEELFKNLDQLVKRDLLSGSQHEDVLEFEWTTPPVLLFMRWSNFHLSFPVPGMPEEVLPGFYDLPEFPPESV